MFIEMTKLLNTLSLSLDYVENEIIKTARNHGKRVAILTNLMAKLPFYHLIRGTVLFHHERAAGKHI